MTNTGGTGDIWGRQTTISIALELRTLQDYINLCGNRPLRFEPGSLLGVPQQRYGFILLGAVIEKVSGQSYYDYVRDHIYVPAGMTSTGSEPEDQAQWRISIASATPRWDQGIGAVAWHPTTGTLPYRGTSAGGGYSTIGDLSAFANALEWETNCSDPQFTGCSSPAG